MGFHVKSGLAACCILIFGLSASASPTCDPFRDAGLQRQAANCERIVNSGAVKNERALWYSIKTMLENHGRLRDPKCANQYRYSTNTTNPQYSWLTDSVVDHGFQNNCSFFMGDIQQPWKKNPQPRRFTGYYIDFCDVNPERSVSTFYFNGGSGKVAKYQGKVLPGNTYTLRGAFMLEGKMRMDFNPFNPEKYRKISKRYGGVPVLRLKGINSCNNNGEVEKPMHVSPFKTSWGCPSVSEDAIPILRRIADHPGPTELMMYDGVKYEQKSSSNCEVNEGYSQTPSEFQQREPRGSKSAE